MWIKIRPLPRHPSLEGTEGDYRASADRNDNLNYQKPKPQTVHEPAITGLTPIKVQLQQEALTNFVGNFLSRLNYPQPETRESMTAAQLQRTLTKCVAHEDEYENIEEVLRVHCQGFHCTSGVALASGSWV